VTPSPPPARGLTAELLTGFTIYTLLAYAAIVVARQPGTIAVVWLANGFGVAMLATARREHLLPLVGAFALANLVANLTVGDALAVSAAFLVPNAVETAIGGLLLRRSGHAGRLPHDHQSFLRALGWGAAVAPLAGALLGAALLQALGFARFERVWLDWYVGDAVGAVVMLPLVLAWRAAPAATLARLLEPGSLLAMVLAVSGAAASLAFMPHPLVVIAVGLSVVAFARPRPVTFACAPLVVALVAVALALGLYEPRTPNTPWGHALLYFSVMLAVLPPQLLAVLVANQRALADMLAAVGSRDDDIIVITDRDGVYRWVNRARERYHGAPASTVLGRTVGELAAGRHDEEQLTAAFRRALAGETTRARAEVRYAVMGTRIMDVRVQPAYDADGHLTGVLFSAGDVTEIETSRRQLEQFVRVASHDLREPLNTVLQFSMLIEQGPLQQLDADGQLYFRQVREGAARMKRMLDDLLQYVRLEGAPAAEPEPVPLDLVFEEVAASLQAQLQASGGTLRAAPELGTVTGHAALITLALQNLVSNALKFVAPGSTPQVEVSSQRTGQELRLTVADTGIGIEAERIGELATPFRRLHARRKYEGTGLGLAIVKRVAEHHGGRLEIASAPGAGSRFTLVLPQRD
jgi:PAS domain S-box-containing protein